MYQSGFHTSKDGYLRIETKHLNQRMLRRPCLHRYLQTIYCTRTFFMVARSYEHSVSCSGLSWVLMPMLAYATWNGYHFQGGSKRILGHLSNMYTLHTPAERYINLQQVSRYQAISDTPTLLCLTLTQLALASLHTTSLT